METTPKRSRTREEKLAQQRDDLLELKGKQIRAAAGETDAIETQKGNKDKAYVLPENEAKYVHLKTTIKHLDEATKSIKKEDRIIKIHAREFDRRIAEGAFKTYDEVKVLHDPRANAPKEYNFGVETVDVKNAPHDENVKLTSSNKIPPAGKPLTAAEKAEKKRLEEDEENARKEQEEADEALAQAEGTTNKADNPIGPK